MAIEYLGDRRFSFSFVWVQNRYSKKGTDIFYQILTDPYDSSMIRKVYIDKDAVNWLKENTEYRLCRDGYHYEDIFEILNEEDAVLFKLKWM